MNTNTQKLCLRHSILAAVLTAISVQDAVIQLAKEAKRKGGITPAEAAALAELARQVGVPVRGPESHPNRPYGKGTHIHVGPVDHIPII